MKEFPKKDWSGLHHQLILFGRYTCTAKNPECETYNLKEICKYCKEKNKE